MQLDGKGGDNKLRKALGVLVVTAMMAVGLAVPSYAFDYTNSFSGVNTELTTALQALIPVVVVVFALILAIRLGIRLFRSVVR
jgi:TRAP-type C4-dicarboxylate transport system permease small subunit